MPEINGSSVPAIIVSPERFDLAPKKKEECVVQITNVTQGALLFRMLTTSPDVYLVKPTKGVIKPNSFATVTITLNTQYKGAGAENGKRTDDFRIEYVELDPEDVVEPRFSNVPALIKAKKQKNRESVHSKSLRCNVTVDSRDIKSADDAGNRQRSLESAVTNKSNDEAGSNGPGAAVKDLRVQEQNTLAEKNRREKVKQEEKKKSTLIFAGLGALGFFIAMWLTSGQQEATEDISGTA